MQIQNSTSQPKFTSRLNPIKPFKIQTKLGELSCAEIPVSDILKTEGKMDEFADFFCRNFATSTDDPYWLAYNEKSKRPRIIRDFTNCINDIMKRDDGNFTMLMASDKDGKLRGACMSYGFEEVPHVRNKVLYVDSLAVDSEYRGFGVGKVLLNKSLGVNRETFTDVFLKGEVSATSFYEKQGFRQMSEDNPSEIFVVKAIAAHGDGDGYPDYFQFFTKPFKKDSPRWYETINNLLQKSF